MQIGDFLIKLQGEEGINAPTPLIAAWSPSRIDNIISDFTASAAATHIAGTLAEPNAESWANRSNQSRGNVVGDFAADILSPSLTSYRISRLPEGQGYPDRRLHHHTDGFICVLELKATSQWDASDGNRRVLLSSTKKLRSNIVSGMLPAQPCHLLMTVNYTNGTSAIDGIRLDFIEPATLVEVRLEASTSHKLLAGGGQRSVVMP